MDRNTYNRMTLNELKGRKVRVVSAFGNNLVSATLGTILTIKGKRDGYDLEGEICPTCKIAPKFSRVQPVYVELLPREVKKEVNP